MHHRGRRVSVSARRASVLRPPDCRLAAAARGLGFRLPRVQPTLGNTLARALSAPCYRGYRAPARMKALPRRLTRRQLQPQALVLQGFSQWSQRDSEPVTSCLQSGRVKSARSRIATSDSPDSGGLCAPAGCPGFAGVSRRFRQTPLPVRPNDRHRGGGRQKGRHRHHHQER
jgi:hypothetical protein